MEIIQHLLFEEKECHRCRTFKPCTEFYKCKQNRDGLQSYCKICTRDQTRTWAHQHAAKLQDVGREYRARNPHIAHTYRAKNREHIRAMRHAWMKRYPERNAAGSNRYYARKKGALGTYTTTEWLALCATYNNRCLCCGREGNLTADHIVPLSKGGTNTIDNLQPLCKPCNSSKWNRTIDYRENTLHTT